MKRKIRSAIKFNRLHLHSSMDRFEVELGAGITAAGGDLHSSMDRFEVICNDCAKKLFANLHSSMDRFEALITSQIPPKMLIYIPVWIDLKSSYITALDLCLQFTFQYG